MKVLVCGTQYGSTYIRALTLNQQQSQSQPTSFSLTGILSKGSERSQTLAQQLNVPYFTDVALIPDEINIACVAVGGDAGKHLTFALLKKGIAVLCEHPVEPNFVQEALTVAQQHQTVFQVNAHFADLYAPQAFLQSLVSAHKSGYGCLHFDLAVNLRTLYSALDLLGRATGNLSDITIVPGQSTPEPSANSLFKTLYLRNQSSTISMLCQNFSSAQDDGSATLLNHRFSAIFPHGTLMLSETTGPLSWFPSVTSMSEEHWKTYLPVDIVPMDMKQMQQHRDQCNITALSVMAAAIQQQYVVPYQSPEYLMALSNLWRAVLKELQPGMFE